jgi:cardiolipin synthase A/B
MNESDVMLITAKQYPQRLEATFHAAKERIIIAAMIGYLDETTEPLFLAAQAAMKRGVSVYIALDVYSYYLLGTPLAAKGRFLKARQQIIQTQELLKKMQAAGATIAILGKLGINPYKKRFHQKFVIADNNVFFGGGVNFSKEHFELTDYMLHTVNKNLANVLVKQLMRIVEYGDSDDSSYQIDSESTLLIDGGKPHQSIIYDRAMALAREAKEISLVSQFCPSGELAYILRTKQAVCYFNRPTQLSGPSIASQVVDQTRFRIKNYYKKSSYIHAKYILFNMPNGQKISLSGSHNFSQRGVDYGTKELAIESTNSAVYRELSHFTNKNIR